jgi:predicted transcriptional regulator
MSKKKSEPDRHLPYRAVRIPLELYRELQEIAEANYRPTSREILKALLEYVAEKKKTQNQDEP